MVRHRNNPDSITRLADRSYDSSEDLYLPWCVRSNSAYRGIKDTKLFVAVNTDENAAIFKVADYGIQADLREVLENYMKL